MAAASARPESAGTIYYVSAAGDDAAPGTSPQQAWRSLARIERAALQPGDRVLLRAGDSFTGQLVLRASGAPGQPLRIGAYGDGPRPLIAGDGHAAAILIRNQQHIEIADIAITNDVQQPRPGEPAEQSFGIEVLNDGGGVLRHFRFERLTIRDVLAQRINDRTEEEFNRVIISAIRFATSRAQPGQPSYFQDILIADNDISRSGRFGVQIGHGGIGTGRQDAHSRDPEAGFNRDIVIRGNRFADLGGSAVQLAGARNALIEDNDFNRTGSSLIPGRMVGRGSGAWVINSRDIVAQHNRSRQVRGYKDSYGMHVDYGNLNVLYQYNYSEESEGGFVEILGNNRNVIWRYNISVNDGLREKAGNTIWFSPFSEGTIPSSGIHIYNNTVFVRPGLYPDIDLRARDAVIRNNIFAVSREAMIGEQLRIEMAEGAPDLAGNLFSGRINPQFKALDRQARQGPPLFVQPGASDPQGYRLRPGSPALGGGAPVRHPPFPAAGQGIFAGVTAEPTVDFFGTPLPKAGSPGIGAAVTVVNWR
ncbi:MAG: right-handed parallel beta-helix repeat-containing protein [Sphingomonadaceae bacterium]|nr:right-handed parallel beta-helix repeat-containing protein [Sphingomonadaceae bacterium]